MNPSAARLSFGLALFAGVAPLWVGRHLPLVDLPQHLHLISVLHRLDDPTTLFPQLFEARGTLTPYLGYYYLVSALGWLFPLELANKLFLSAYVVGMPLSLAFLLRSLGRPTWPALLSLPFAYGDSLAWGFINYCSALPLSFLTMGLFVRAVVDEPRRRRHAAALAVSLVAVLLFHVQAFAYLGVALPFLLLTTRAPQDGGQSWSEWLRARQWALWGVVPGVVLFLVWVGLRLGEPTEVEAGAPWKAWGPLLSAQNLSFKTFAQNRADLFHVVANMLADGSDRYGFYAVLAIAAAGLVLALTPWGIPQDRNEGLKELVERWRMVGRAVRSFVFSLLQRPRPLLKLFGDWRMAGLSALALALFFSLPFDIRGYMYYLNTRFAHLAWPLLLAAVPVVSARAQRLLGVLAAATAVVLAIPLSRGFAAFDEEARALDDLAALTAERPMVMGLIFDPRSQVVGHPVYLHAATVLARARGGATNFSFALTPHSPLEYRGMPPPTFPSEWRPDQFSYPTMGKAYDHFLVRGVHPARIFGALLDTELAIAGQSRGFWLVRRR
ncbi:MAG: hypothetical protein ACOZIN_20160 [Myxococcota bacterium]